MDNRVLRGLFCVADSPEMGEASLNWLHFDAAGLEPADEGEASIVRYLRQFHTSMTAAPEVAIMRAHFEADDDVNAVDRLAEVAGAQPYIRTNYISILQTAQTQQRLKAFDRLAREAQNIAHHGVQLKKPVVGPDGELKRVARGLADAVEHLHDGLARIAPATSGAVMTDADDIFAPLPPIDWLCEELRLARNGGVVLFAGYGFSGKSVLAQAAALSVAAGKPLGGRFPCKRGRVAHVDYEQGAYVTRLRYQRLALGMEIGPHDEAADLFRGALNVTHFPPHRLDQAGAERHWGKMMEGRRLLIIDSLRAACPSLDENSSEIRKPLDMLNGLADRTGCVPLVIHHSKKPTEGAREVDARTVVRGSSAIFDASASCYVLVAKKDEPTRLEHVKERFGRPVRPLRMEIVGENDQSPLRVEFTPEDDWASGAAADHDRQIREAIVTAIRESPNGVPNQRALLSIVKGRTQRVTEALGVLVANGTVEKRADGYHAAREAPAPKPEDLI